MATTTKNHAYNFQGNKGGVSIRFDTYGSSICTVNAHLAAHDDELDERIEDYKQILDDHKYHVDGTNTIFRHDYAFWFGDLNFRIDEKFLPNPHDVQRYIEEDKLDELIQRDQLVLIRESGRAFQNLTEKLPQFPPTFKFIEGTNQYDLK